MDKIYPEEHIQAIANAIRRKNGKSVNYLTSEMAGAIDQLVSYPEPTGTQTITENGIVDVKDKAYADVNVQASATLISKTIIANGEYDAEDDEADGYSDVTVNVPNSYSESDEGKVVSSGALVAQTSTTKTANGTYDTTENNEVVVNVPQPSGNINITDMQSTDVSAYATAQVVDSDLVAGNIKKDVDILGVVGTYEGSGGGSTLITKTITQNGIYNAEDDNADGFSSVTVNVSDGGSPKGFEVYAADFGGGSRANSGFFDNQYFACFIDDNMSSNNYTLNGVSTAFSIQAAGRAGSSGNNGLRATTRAVTDNPTPTVNNACIEKAGSEFTASHRDFGSYVSVVGGWVGYPTGGDVYEQAGNGTTNSITLNSAHDTLLIFVGASINGSAITSIDINGATYDVINLGTKYDSEYGSYTAIEIDNNSDTTIAVTFPVSCYNYVSIVGID